MIEFGAIYPAALNLFDVNNNPVNATTVSLVITQPDQTTVVCNIQNPPAVTGQYNFPFVTTQPGRHLVNWSTVNPITAYTDVFDVNEQAPPSILSLADAKQTLGMSQSYTDDDDELRGKLRAMTKAIENYKHEAYAYRTVTQFDNWAPIAVPWQSPKLRLTFVPVIALVSLVTVNAASVVTTTYDVINNLYVDGDTGLVSVINGPPLAGRMKTIYTAGMQIIPYNVIEGARVMLQFLWATRRGPGGLNAVTGPEELSDFRHANNMPRKVTAWLGPPRPTIF